MLRAIIPIFLNFRSQIQQPCLRINTRMINFTFEENLRGSTREVLKLHFEFEFCVLVQAVSHKNHPVPH